MTSAVTGIGRTVFSRESGRTPLSMAAEACRKAIEDAGLEVADVDGWGTFLYNDSALPQDVAWACGRDEVEWAPALHGGGNMATQIVADAVSAVETGRCRAAVVYRSLNGRSGYRFGTVSGQMSMPGQAQYDAPSGYLVPPQYLAMWARRYLSQYGRTVEDLGHVAITQRTHAMNNPHALMQTPLSMDEYLASRWICDPFRVNDCAFEVDGAVAVVIVSADMAKDAPSTPAWVIGSSGSISGSGWTAWDDMASMYSRDAAPRLWKRTGLAPTDIDVALMYDCFTYTVLATMEEYGFCERGAAGDFFASGRATHGGDVVVNPHGGLLSEGYLHGMNHHFEAVAQLRGDAAGRQVADARLALVTAGAGPFGGAMIYSSEEP